MEDRSNKVVALRPEIPNALVNANMNPEEQFQNATLRPILKFQHDLLIQVFRQYMIQKKVTFEKLTKPQKIEHINQVFFRDHRFKNLLKGLVLGQFTLEEYATYQANSSALSKRMFSMMKERFLNSLSELG